MVEDLISIMTSFSARLYGRRGSKKIKKTLSELEMEGQYVKESE
jgi:putative resolvase